MDTKTALLDAAENAVRVSGYDGFSYADLAEVVGIRKASIHYHFPKKSDLGLALMQRYAQGLEDQLAAIDASSKTAADRLSGQINRYRDALGGGQRVCLCVALSTSPDDHTDALVKEIATFRDRSVAALQEVFEHGVKDGTIRNVQEPNAEARATLATLEGAHLAARVAKDITVFDAAVSVLKDRI